MTLWIFNFGLLVTPIQGLALLLGLVSCHRTGFLFSTVSEFIGYFLTKFTPVMTAGPYQTQRRMINYVTTTQRRKRTAKAYGAIFTDDREKTGQFNSMYTSGFLIK